MIFSADDFGISRSVNEGILELTNLNRLSSVGCMVLNSSHCADLAALSKFENKIDIGLHLVLTDFAPLSRMTVKSGLVAQDGHLLKLSRLVTRVAARQIDTTVLENEIRLQINKFTEVLGFYPSFVDGHQHVQQLPVLRSALVNVLKENPLPHYVRSAYLPLRWLIGARDTFSTKSILANSAICYIGKSFQTVLENNKISYNRYLMGYYDVKSKISFKAVFVKYLSLNPSAKDVFFAHPGYIDEQLRNADSLIEEREEILNFMKSSEFFDLCAQYGVSLNRFKVG